LSEPFLYNPIGTPFIELLSIDSTNNYALTQLHAGLTQHGTAFFAYEQEAGKGQRGKTWTSSKNDGLILSVVIGPSPLQVTQQFQLSACIAISVAGFFSRYAGSATRIKWPNDLYWYDRKAGGILIENIIGRRPIPADVKSPVKSQQPITNDQQAASWLWAVAGIGININQTAFPSELANPVSLKQITGIEFPAVELAKELCFIIDGNFKELVVNGFEGIYASYLSLLYKKNEPVKLKKDNRVFEAIIRSVSPTGELIVQHAVEETFGFGKIEWVIPASKP
jgi:BirA family biotin operon repressor/biotin-[acetyl-CoA-carboxylase] ligase